MYSLYDPGDVKFEFKFKIPNIYCLSLFYSPRPNITGKRSKFLNAGSSQDDAAFNNYVKLFLHKLPAAGC